MKAKGFTLVEVIVVIGIVAILTVIIFPALNDIRKKNRDTERIADIAALQLGLSLYYSQSTTTTGYPTDLSVLTPKYVPADSLVGPDGVSYSYVPLMKGSGPKCTSYHLGTVLELDSSQIDTADNFSSIPGQISNGYVYCGGYSGPGIATGTKKYNVHP